MYLEQIVNGFFEQQNKREKPHFHEVFPSFLYELCFHFIYNIFTVRGTFAGINFARFISGCVRRMAPFTGQTITHAPQ